jgi:predicted ester cyclase
MDSGSGGASAERSKEVFRRLIEEGFNKGNLEALDDCFPLRYVEHQFAMPSTREEFKRTIRSLRETLSPFSLTIEDMVADGDKVWARMTGRGTDSKGYRGRPPTGKSFAITVIDVCRFEDGKITEHWGVPDRFHQLAQLGLLPRPGEQASGEDGKNEGARGAPALSKGQRQ